MSKRIDLSERQRNTLLEAESMVRQARVQLESALAHRNAVLGMLDLTPEQVESVEGDHLTVKE